MKSLHGLESQPTVKDADSPAGHTFHAPKDFSSLPDCPVCKYGTPMEIAGNLICIDCGAIVGRVEK